MSIKLKKSDLVIASAVTALILAAVLAGLAACQNPVTGIDLDAPKTQGLDTGPTTNGGYRAATLTVPNFRTVPGGYTGPARITYYNYSDTLYVTVTAAGLLEYPPSRTLPTGSIKSITLTDVNKTHLIGRLAQSGAPLIVLNLDTGGDLHFRPAVSGSIPIGTYAEFQLINTVSGALGGAYKQEADLDLMGGMTMSSLWDIIAWTPVGAASGSAFIGTYDGNGKKLLRLQINTPGSASPVGLFSQVGSTGVIKNVGIESGAVVGNNNVGGVAGISAGSITACYNNASVKGSRVSGTGNNVGGVVGTNSGTIFACYNSGTVSGNESSEFTGGVAGISTGNITACYNTGMVAGFEFIGGVAGTAGNITACYNTGTVGDSTVSNKVGGVVGVMTGNITACYNTGTVFVQRGGLAGGVAGSRQSGSMANCYWKGTGTQAIGGASGSTSNSFGAYFSPGSSGEWGTGNGSGSGTYWMSGTTNGAQLPRLWFE
ncbi:hypothetical protein AGMMS49579_03330 [Spirochaetia bacterium]|nr:hypothetical protein AGMMS49579_03330 [Spirochaetia bacterium]